MSANFRAGLNPDLLKFQEKPGDPTFTLQVSFDGGATWNDTLYNLFGLGDQFIKRAPTATENIISVNAAQSVALTVIGLNDRLARGIKIQSGGMTISRNIADYLVNDQSLLHLRAGDGAAPFLTTYDDVSTQSHEIINARGELTANLAYSYLPTAGASTLHTIFVLERAAANSPYPNGFYFCTQETSGGAYEWKPVKPLDGTIIKDATAVSLDASSAAYAQLANHPDNDGTKRLTIGVPRGANGQPGADGLTGSNGDPALMSISEPIVLNPNQDPTVDLTAVIPNLANEYTLDFSLPRAPKISFLTPIQRAPGADATVASSVDVNGDVLVQLGLAQGVPGAAGYFEVDDQPPGVGVTKTYKMLINADGSYIPFKMDKSDSIRLSDVKGIWSATNPSDALSFYKGSGYGRSQQLEGMNYGQVAGYWYNAESNPDPLKLGGGFDPFIEHNVDVDRWVLMYINSDPTARVEGQLVGNFYVHRAYPPAIIDYHISLRGGGAEIPNGAPSATGPAQGAFGDTLTFTEYSGADGRMFLFFDRAVNMTLISDNRAEAPTAYRFEYNQNATYRNLVYGVNLWPIGTVLANTYGIGFAKGAGTQQVMQWLITIP